MLETRVIPCLLLRGWGLVKTVKFKNAAYVGDPINTVRIFNELEVDEILFLDITASIEKKRPPFKIIEEIASECFMPFTYGGGLRSITDLKTVFSLGVEKVALNSYAIENPDFIRQAAEKFGNQSIVVSIDAKKNIFGNYTVYAEAGRKNTGLEPAGFARQMEKMGAGEILITSIDRDGTFGGYDVDLIAKISSAVNIPVIACGGARSISDFKDAVNAGASALAAGSMFVFQGKNRGVLINFPGLNELEKVVNRG